MTAYEMIGKDGDVRKTVEFALYGDCVASGGLDAAKERFGEWAAFADKVVDVLAELDCGEDADPVAVAVGVGRDLLEGKDVWAARRRVPKVDVPRREPVKLAVEGMAIDVTMSGYVLHEYLVGKTFERRPGGFWRPYVDGEVVKTTVNAMCVESFKEITYPVLEIKCRLKPGVGAFRRWWWEGWNDSKIYDVDVKEVGRKTVTYVRLVSSGEMFVDQPAEVFKKALGGLRVVRGRA